VTRMTFEQVIHGYTGPMRDLNSLSLFVIASDADRDRGDGPIHTLHIAHPAIRRLRGASLSQCRAGL
jgi:hypothetical protein